MSTLISGGAKSGKSMLAQRLVGSAGAPRWYIATMIPCDAEDLARIRRHRLEREGWGFITLECPRGILSCFERADPGDRFLLDSVTALLANEMFPPEGFDPAAPKHIACELCEFVHRAPNTVLVSDFIYSDAALYDATTQAYRAGLAMVDRALARCCDNVLETCAGRIIIHKGGILL